MTSESLLKVYKNTFFFFPSQISFTITKLLWQLNVKEMGAPPPHTEDSLILLLERHQMCYFSRPRFSCSDFANVCNICSQSSVFPVYPVAWRLELGVVCCTFTQLGSHSATSSKGHFPPIGNQKESWLQRASKVKICWNWQSALVWGIKEMKSWKYSWKGRKGTRYGFKMI